MANDILFEINQEIKRAKKKHPTWPVHIVSRGAIVCEEAGELIRACLQLKYETPEEAQADQMKEIRKEAVQVAASAIRFLELLNEKRTNSTSPIQSTEAVAEMSIPLCGSF